MNDNDQTPWLDISEGDIVRHRVSRSLGVVVGWDFAKDSERVEVSVSTDFGRVIHGVPWECLEAADTSETVAHGNSLGDNIVSQRIREQKNSSYRRTKGVSEPLL